MDDFVRFGVREYVVYDAKAKVTHWFKLPTREKLIADRAGVFKSDVFPGLWLDSKALARGDSASLIAAVEKGTKSAAHRRFVERLKAAQRS